MIRSHHWKKTASGIIADFFGETHFKVKIGQESEPVSVEHCGVEYCQSRAAGYPK